MRILKPVDLNIDHRRLIALDTHSVNDMATSDECAKWILAQVHGKLNALALKFFGRASRY